MAKNSVMDKKSTLMITTCLSCGLVSTTALAFDEPEPTVDEIELGIGYVFDDAYKYGRYTGLEEEGEYIIGDLKSQGFAEDGGFWKVRGTNLGLDSRFLRFDFGDLGRHEFFLEYDQLPNNKSNTANTPFLGVGSSNLTLPADIDFINISSLNSALRPFDIETERRRIGFGGGLIAKKHWKFNVAYRHETKEGVDKIGGSIVNQEQQLVGNTTAALLPEPIDYETDIVDASLTYARDKAQVDLRYHISLYDNNNQALTWEDPFSPGDFASQSLAPDNEFQQLMLTGSYLFPYNSRVTGMVSYGRMTQDEAFLPNAIDPAVSSALPRDSLDAEVWLTSAKLKLASRPTRKLRLSAGYRYDERDSDDTPVDTYIYPVADSPTVTGGPVENRPLSYERNRADIMANYRFTHYLSLRGGYKYEEMSRDYVDVEREDTEENTLFTKLKLRPHSAVNLALYAEGSERDGSEYLTPANENPALRKYHLADRDRTKLGAAVDIMPTEALSFTVTADYIKDEYDDSEIGLTESESPTYSLDVNYAPHKKVTTYAYYTREDIQSKQAGSETVLTTPDWEADFEDTVDSYGVGVKLTKLGGKWDVGLDVFQTKATGEIDMQDLTAPGTETQFPDLETELTGVKLWTLYRHRKNMAFKLGYRYEKYKADNWAVDDLQEDSITNLLLLGEDTLDDVHEVAVSYIYRFD